jgi:hypothetical protein
VFATQSIKSGDFVLEYCGNLISPDEADGIVDESYIYHFQIGSTFYW